MVTRNLDEIDKEGRWENDIDLVEHLIHDVLNQTEVEVISATRIPKTKADDRNRIVVVTLNKKKKKRRKVLKVAKNLREKEEWKRVHQCGPDEKRAGDGRR